MVTVFCHKCYFENSLEDEYCKQCNAKLNEENKHSDYVDKLISFSLHHPVPSVPQMAAKVLGEIGDARAVEPLIKILKSTSDPGLQESAVEALGKLGDSRAVPAIACILKDGSLAARLKAIAALKRIGGRESIKAIEYAALNDINQVIRKEALLAIDDIQNGDSND